MKEEDTASGTPDFSILKTNCLIFSDLVNLTEKSKDSKKAGRTPCFSIKSLILEKVLLDLILI